MTHPDKAEIEARLDDDVGRAIGRFDVFADIDSTNSHLLRQPPPSAQHLSVALADHQTDGRGRHDRAWISAPDASVCLSAAYTFRKPPRELPPLTLALGLGIARRLMSEIDVSIGIKWPNDLLADGGKLGGILTEVHSATDRATVVAGVGINVAPHARLADVSRDENAPRPTDLVTLLQAPPSRAQLAAMLVNAMFETFVTYDQAGFGAFRDAFASVDWLAGKRVGVAMPNGAIRGVAAGIDRDGRLRVDTGSGVSHVLSGSVRVLAEGGAVQ